MMIMILGITKNNCLHKTQSHPFISRIRALLDRFFGHGTSKNKVKNAPQVRIYAIAYYCDGLQKF